MVQVYAVNISNISQQEYEILYSKSSSSRKTRASNCRSRENAVCCITAEALLRYAFKKHLSLTAYELEYNIHGKPRLIGHEGVHFNLSHSGHWVVLAYGTGEVGIDVEKLQDERKVKVARRFYAEEEQRFVFSGEEEQLERFLEIWTAKESYLKYLGTGLQKPLNDFDVCTMQEPRFFTRWLEGYCMTLCTTEEEYQMTVLSPEQLR